MTFEEAVKHENNNKTVNYNNSKYYVIGHNKLTQTVTIRELSGNLLFTVPVDVKAEELS
ncbi:hypothetical protein [Limosilactobacillus ingluviei]|uniref:Uncharacterized protein n=1 Tax=Limosilactobacillus ingluviei DSM 15946 TaxID=1423760 RepID=A0A0R1UHH0_9LACO|nr:hypothetical protein [Limosilactobacillus ingluviei]KRL92340.1 hypothetical protein FC43_GL001994 [Limosilactobacillus ingluviei DSM 15946]